ncbi:hypothetical protein [Parvibaculum sp.]|jgi:hypothetical protein|nr:hypothetical protein [Parvibaculum sp.]|tara:strand:+ start:7866 stop:8009 length:144 start_codon:yes stop_codon:yes gene_type:complete
MLNIEKTDNGVIHIRASGKLTQLDCDIFGVQFDKTQAAEARDWLMRP